MNLPSFSLPCLPLRLPIRKSLLLATGLMFTVAIRAQTANLTVDTTKTVRTVDERVFGLNAACWDWFFNNWPAAGTATTSLLSTIGTRSLRYPGGSMSDTYNWVYDTITDSSGTSAQGANIGQFLQVATSLNASVFITVNYGSGTPQEAAAWVAYCNASSSLQGTAGDVALGVDAYGTDWRTRGTGPACGPPRRSGRTTD